VTAKLQRPRRHLRGSNFRRTVNPTNSHKFRRYRQRHRLPDRARPSTTLVLNNLAHIESAWWQCGPEYRLQCGNRVNVLGLLGLPVQRRTDPLSATQLPLRRNVAAKTHGRVAITVFSELTLVKARLRVGPTRRP